jgi:hypothetical protein
VGDAVRVALAPRQDQAVLVEEEGAQTVVARGLQVELELLAALSSRRPLDTTVAQQTDQAVLVEEEEEEALQPLARHRPEQRAAMEATATRGQRITSRTLVGAVAV